MKTYVLVYEGFVQFEVILTNYFMNTVGEVVTVGIDNDTVTSHEGFQTIPHLTIEEVDIEDIDLFVIPGGTPQELFGKDKFYELIKKLDSNNIVIGSICASPIHLAKAGVLAGKKFTTTLPVDEFDEFTDGEYVDEIVVIDDNIVTAKARGYVDFALELGKIMDIYDNDDDLQETINYFKYYKI